jgi:esterase/lipase superfamily enzyme
MISVPPSSTFIDNADRRRRSSTILAALLAVAAALSGGCAGSQPKPNQIFLMPAPGVYAEGAIDPFIDNDPIGRGVQPGILYATDRKRAAPDDEDHAHYTYRRARKLQLGLARVRLGQDDAITWDEARRISLLKDRPEEYPLEVTGIEELGALEQTVPPGDDQTLRSPEPGRRFIEEVNERLAASAKKDVYIYVHGYKVNFENPILVAAELWHFLGYNGAFIAYSWPTKFSMWAYFADLDNAVNSARYLRTLVIDLARKSDAERIHIIGYSAGTRLVSRMLADLGMYAYLMDEEEIDRTVKLGNVILIGSDVDQDILAGYLLDGGLRVADSLTLYVSEADSALRFSRRMFRGRERAGELLDRTPLNPRAKAFMDAHPELRIIDVTEAEGGTGGSGHSYFRSSPWVSSDLLMTLLYDLTPAERGLVKEEDFPIWGFPPNYVERLRTSLASDNPALAVKTLAEATD